MIGSEIWWRENTFSVHTSILYDTHFLTSILYDTHFL